jgi:hypothetical protein
MDTPSVTSFKLLPEMPQTGADVLAAAYALESQLRSLEHQHALAQAMYDEKSVAVQTLEEELVRLLMARRERTLEKNSDAGSPEHARRALEDEAECSWVHLTVNWDDAAESLELPDACDADSTRLSDVDTGASFGSAFGSCPHLMARIVSPIPDRRGLAARNEARHPFSIFSSTLGRPDGASAISEANSNTLHDPGARPAAFNAVPFASMPALSERAHADNSPLAHHMIEQQRIKKKGKTRHSAQDIYTRLSGNEHSENAPPDYEAPKGRKSQMHKTFGSYSRILRIQAPRKAKHQVEMREQDKSLTSVSN